MSTKVEQFIADLDSGNFEDKLSKVLSHVASAVVDHGKMGTIDIKLKIGQIGSSHQVQVTHTTKYSHPTPRGDMSESESGTTAMYVGTRGAMTFFPEKQEQMFDIKGSVNPKIEHKQ